MNQELFIVFREKKHEPETVCVLAVFNTEELAHKYITKLRQNEYRRLTYTYFTVEQELLTDLPK